MSKICALSRAITGTSTCTYVLQTQGFPLRLYQDLTGFQGISSEKWAGSHCPDSQSEHLMGQSMFER